MPLKSPRGQWVKDTNVVSQVGPLWVAPSMGTQYTDKMGHVECDKFWHLLHLGGILGKLLQRRCKTYPFWSEKKLTDFQDKSQGYILIGHLCS